MSYVDANLLNLDFAKTQRARLAAPPQSDMVSELRVGIKGHSTGFVVGRIAKAMRGPGGLTAAEFFYYRLYDAATDGELRRFVGKAVQHKLHMACNDERWFAAAHDKILWSAALAGAGYPVPETVAVFGRSDKGVLLPQLRTREEVVAYLAKADYPLFCKPIDGINSLGALRLESLSEGRLSLNGGQLHPIEEVADYIANFDGAGYLFQKVLRPAPEIEALSGQAVASVRFLVLLENGGARIESAVLKIPSLSSVADNYWRSGNLLGAIDLESGALRRAVTGTGSGLKECDIHSDTGATLNGFRLPDFERAAALCRGAAGLFPGIRTQSWDVALTATGPVFLEMNFGGDLNLHQLAHNRGALTPSYAAHLRACGYKGKLPVD